MKETAIQIEEVLSTLESCKLKPFYKYPHHNKAVDTCIATFKTKYGLVDDYSKDKPIDAQCFVYYIHCKARRKVKIGITNEPFRRLRELQNASADELEILHIIKFDSMEEAHRAEKALHGQFRKHRKRPSASSRPTEWFDDCIVTELVNNYKTPSDIFSKCIAEKNITYKSGVTTKEEKQKAANAVLLRKRETDDICKSRRMEWVNGKLQYVG